MIAALLFLAQLATPTPRPTRPPPLLGRAAATPTPGQKSLVEIARERAAVDAEYKRIVEEADATVARQQETMAAGIRALNEDFRLQRIDGWTFEAKKKALLDQERDVYERAEATKRQALNAMRSGGFVVTSGGVRFKADPLEKDEKGRVVPEKPRPTVRLVSIRHTVADSIGNVWISGMVHNAGPGDACFVHIGVKLITKDGATLGTSSTYADSSKILKGEDSSFKTSVAVPEGTRAEVRHPCPAGVPFANPADDACVSKQNQGSRGPEIDHAEGFIEEASACR